MIGIIISGHGHFASGIYSSIKLIVGEQQQVGVVDFEAGMNAETLSKRLNESVEEVDKGDGVAIFTDIPGGTPFNQSALLTRGRSNIKVISGTNLPLLLDGMFSRGDSLEKFVEKVMESGKSGIQGYAPKERQERENNDGI